MADLQMIQRTLEVFCSGQVTAIRCLDLPRGQKILCETSGDLARLARLAAGADDLGAKGCYFVPNPVRPERAGQPGGLKKAHIAARYWLLIDCDPRYPTDMSSSEGEMVAAWLVLCAVRVLLESLGFRGAVVGCSGNGWHLCFPILKVHDDATQELLKSLLHGLQARCGDHLSEMEELSITARKPLETPKAIIDTGCHDGPRIWKLYGTTARKGIPSPERPHRQAFLVEGEPWAEEVARANAGLLPLALAALLEPYADLDQWGAEARPERWEDKEGEEIYCRNGLEAEALKIEATPVGSRNQQLNNSGLAIGELVGTGRIGYEECLARLYLAAVRAGCDNPVKDKSTISRALRDGMKNPRVIPRMQDPAPAAASPVLDTAKMLIDRASDIPPVAVQWLWPGVIPLGKLTTFAGVGGLGKTFVLCDLAARVSTGKVWPFSGGECAPEGQVLFISGEDDPADTLVPRMIEMGANLANITFLKMAVQTKFTLADLLTLRAAIKQTGKAVHLVVIDPPTAYVGEVDDHKNSELRGLLAPLSALAQELRIAIIFNTHLNKAQGKIDAMMRVMGSVAWVNAVRAAHLFVRNPENPEERFFLPMKMNLARERKGLAYKITPTEDLARVDWLNEVDITADEAVGPATKKNTASTVTAAEWLIERFRERLEWRSNDLFSRGKSEGVGRDAIFKAKKSLDLPKPRKVTDQDGSTSWVWWVPANWTPLSQHQNGQDCSTDGLSAMQN